MVLKVSNWDVVVVLGTTDDAVVRVGKAAEVAEGPEGGS